MMRSITYPLSYRIADNRHEDCIDLAKSRLFEEERPNARLSDLSNRDDEPLKYVISARH